MAQKPPRITIAVPSADLRRRLESLLEETQSDVETLEPTGDLLDLIRDQDSDVVVLRRSQLPEDLDLEEIAEEEKTPGIVILSEDTAPTERARLVAAGASEVITPDDDDDTITEVLGTVAEAEVEGGRDGPEVAGNRAEPKLVDFLSRSDVMRDFVDMVVRVVDVKTSLLMTGETGVGKDRLARAIHNESSRSSAPFVSVNCGALPEQLLESELFGHEKGAFTGADSRRVGLFESAEGGTIFLDEIGDMPLQLQVKLLTVLQRHEIQPLGATKPVRVDVRVMAATNSELPQLIEEGEFREDLYFRLNVITLKIPALRERIEDIPDLVGAFIRHFRNAQPNCDVNSLTPRAMRALMRYEWPGNVRELINVVERALLLCDGQELDLADLPESVRANTEAPVVVDGAEADADERTQTFPPDITSKPLKQAREDLLKSFETMYLRALLTETAGNVGETAERAGIGPRSLYDKMKRYGLRKEDFKE